jgi:hypothetical protein|uniref:thiol oxidase n=1 Tax=viral metagenome TaxID=1070528 RepID=A0A6C0F780_9ZZZZ|tara:strand:- start:1657 stop:2049 length:393 start_codon:yes stop_codon:yes gene_type:complete
MEPKIWGEHAWIFLHTITLNYPEEPTFSDKYNYKILFESLKDTLPCPTCREHYKENITLYPIDLSSREALVKWLIKIHNLVNEKNGKRNLSYEEVIDYYKSLYNPTFKYNNYIKAILVLIILIIIFFIIK